MDRQWTSVLRPALTGSGQLPLFPLSLSTAAFGYFHVYNRLARVDKLDFVVMGGETRCIPGLLRRTNVLDADKRPYRCGPLQVIISMSTSVETIRIHHLWLARVSSPLIDLKHCQTTELDMHGTD